jgi:hypothetical protein
MYSYDRTCASAGPYYYSIMPTPTTDLAAALTETIAAYRAAMAAGDTLRAAHMECRANAILEAMLG